MEFPDYIIPTTDDRFVNTFVYWSIDVLGQLGNNPLLDEFNDTIITRYVQPQRGKSKKQVLESSILHSYDLLKKSINDEALLCYDSAVYKYDYLCEEIAYFLSKQTTFECEIKLFTAFELSNNLSNLRDTSDNSQIIDNPIPDVNVIVLTYTGPKEFLFAGDYNES